MKASRLAILSTACVALIFAGCSDDDEGTATTSVDDAPEETNESGIQDAEAEARAAAVEFFEAQATLDYDAALERSSGAAATGVEWAQAVNAIDQVSGTPQAVKATPSVSITVSIDQVSTGDDDLYRASGYIQLDQHPSVLVPGPTDGIEGETPSGWFATDLVFTADGNRLLVDDYRMDDSPYPVSQLFRTFDDTTAVVAFEDPAGGEGAAGEGAGGGSDDAAALADSIDLDLGHQDLDRTVAYQLSHDPTTMLLSSATFVATDQSPTEVPFDQPGDELDLLQEEPREPDQDPTTTAGPTTTAAEENGTDGDGTTDDETEDDDDAEDDDVPFLVVHPDASPGAQGVLRLTFTNPESAPDRVVTIHVAVPAMPELVEQATNEIRRLLTSTTTTTTSTTTTTTSTTSTTTPTSVVPVPVPGPSQPSTTPPPSSTTTTAASSTTSTTR